MLEHRNRDKEHMLKENQKEGGHGQKLSSERKCEITRLAHGRLLSTWEHQSMRSADRADRCSRGGVRACAVRTEQTSQRRLIAI